MSRRSEPNQLVAMPAAEQDVGYEQTRFNALRHGVLSRYTVLPWESESEYQDILHALADEHQPRGPTEEHLVEELAGVLWRKRRLRMAEAAALRRGLSGTRSYGATAKFAVAHLSASVSQIDVGEAISATDEDTQASLAELVADEAQTLEAVGLLKAGGFGAYDAALRVLRDDTRTWWHQVLVEPDAEREPYSPDAESLIRFLREEVGEWYENRRSELEHRPLIKSQALGEALEPNRFEQLSRYEVHLDRKLERVLAMLLRLQEIRRAARSA